MKISTLSIAVLLLSPFVLHAHPHTYIDMEAGIEVSSDGVEVSVYDETSYVSFALRYVDDGQDEALRTSLDIVRDHEVYSHGNDFGNPSIVFVMSPVEAGPGPSRSTIAGGLVPSSSLPPVPGGTFSNPFILPGLDLDASSNPNPLYGAP